MATSSEESGGELNCAICIQPYCVPRKLTGCSHSFCKSCIVKLVLDLRKDDEPGNEFECPVCRLPSSSPRKDEVVHRWVESLEEDLVLKAKLPMELKRDLAENCCEHCLSKEKVVASAKYCLICREYYCNTCSDTVHDFKINKNHILIDADTEANTGFHQQVLKMLGVFNLCSKHPEDTVAFYCVNENKFCCANCAKRCSHIEPISTLTEERFKAESAKLLDLTSKLMKHIDSVVMAILTNNEDNKKKVAQIDNEFQEMKQNVINLLNILEENLKEEEKGAIKNAAVKNQDEIDDLNIHKNTLKSVNYLLEKLDYNISPMQAFIYMREAEQVIESIERKIIEKGSAVKTEGIELTSTETFQLIQNIGVNETAKLASIAQPETSIDLPTYEDRPFLRKFSIQKTGDKKICPDPYKPGKPLEPTYSGLQFLPENRLLLVDSYHGFCCTVDEEFNLSNKWTVLTGIVDINNCFSNERYATYLGHDIIAVSIPTHKLILLVTSDGLFASRGEIKCEYEPKALCLIGSGDIAVAWDKPVAFGIISSQVWNCKNRVICGSGSQGSPALPYNEKVYFTEDKSGRQLKSFQFMALDEERRHVIQPCDVDKAVYCFDTDGNAVFCYSNESLKNPRGVALDCYGNIYVCEKSHGSIHIISHEGIGITIIKEGCPKTPFAVGFNKDKGTFAVTQYGKPFDSIHFFSVIPK